ncbi:MAG: hypothetical protein HY717_16495 [Planctomycetes bacterium]|nr:hypothetical protein [Planctomycetota bacterium]
MEGYLEALAFRKEFLQLAGELRDLVTAYPSSTDARYLAGKFLTRAGEPEAALIEFEMLKDLALRGSLSLEHPATESYIAAQLEVDSERLPCRRLREENLGANLAALAAFEPRAVEELKGATDATNLRAVDLWGELVLACATTKRPKRPSLSFYESVQNLLQTSAPVVFWGVHTGQEVLCFLRRSSRAELKRFHYLFEKDLPTLKEFLRLKDISAAIEDERLKIFGGPELFDAFTRIFSTGRYPPPLVNIGDRGDYFSRLEGGGDEGRRR